MRKKATKKNKLQQLGILVIGYLSSFLLGVGTTFVLEGHQRPLQKEIEAFQNATMTVSAYAATDFPGRVATGTIGKVGRDVAVSPDRLDLLGKKIYIKDVGVRVVSDVMAEGSKQCIDVLVPDKKCAKEFGKTSKEIYVIHNQSISTI